MKDEIEEIEQKIKTQIKQWAMLPEGSIVVIGLSGGADSVALAHFLKRYVQGRDLSLLAAHVNHGLRGGEADRDESFVQDFCGRLGLELRVLQADIRAEAKKNSQGLEECGRNVRYSFFQSLCGRNGKVATAHTLSDSSETVLMNLAKGSGARGLCGIPPVRGNIIRPLIAVTRTEVEQYCLYYHLQYVTDSTNMEDEYARNRIRHNVVPTLKEINPNFEESVWKTTEILRCGEEYLLDCARQRLRQVSLENGYCLKTLRETPRAVLMRLIPLILSSRTKSRLEYGHIEAVEKIICAGHGSVTVAGRIQCTAYGNTLIVSPQNRVKPAGWEIPLDGELTRLPDGRVFCIRKVEPSSIKNQGKINNLFFNNLVNYDTILNNSRVRSRKNGDRFRPFGRRITKTLKKLLNEQKIPPLFRDRVAVLESGGEILWIEGIGVSEKAAVTDKTQNVAQITIKEC